MIELTERQRKFAESYAKHGIGEKAALEAGYSAKSAKSQAVRLLTYANVKEKIANLLKPATEEAGVTVKRIVNEFALIAFADLADFVEWDANSVRLKDSKSIDPEKRRAIVSISQTQFGIKITLADKVAALDRLGKHQGMFDDAKADAATIPTPVNVVVKVEDASIKHANPQ